MVNLVLSIRSVFATIQSSAKIHKRKGQEGEMVFSEKKIILTGMVDSKLVFYLQLNQLEEIWFWYGLTLHG